MTSYMLYYMEQKKKMGSDDEHAHLPLPELSKVMAEKFQNLKPNKKRRYEDKYTQARDQYKKDVEQF
jgi:hypothetical protein